MNGVGRLLADGLLELGTSHGLGVRIAGPPAMPFMVFDEDDEIGSLSYAFAGQCARHGVFLHPGHNWFLTTAHTEADILETLEAADHAFAHVASTCGDLLEVSPAQRQERRGR